MIFFFRVPDTLICQFEVSFEVSSTIELHQGVSLKFADHWQKIINVIPTYYESDNEFGINKKFKQ